MRRAAMLFLACAAYSTAQAGRQTADERGAVLQALDRYERTAGTGSLVFQSARSLTSALNVAVPEWIASAPEDRRARRREAAALMVLDFTLADYRTGLGGASVRPVLIEWGSDFLRQTAPSEFERIWLLVSYAILQTSGAAFGDGSRAGDAHLDHALERFPADPRLRLARLLSRPVAWGLSNRPGATESRLIRSPLARRVQGVGSNSVTAWPLPLTLRELEALEPDVVVGAEARAHAGLIRFHKNDLRRSLEDLTTAANAATDPFVRNLAWLLAGLNYDAQQRATEATTALERAVMAIPTAKASATALAAHWFLAGRREEASAVLDAAYGVNPPTLDPWQHIGDMMRFVPAWMAALHAMVGHPAAEIVSPRAVRFDDVTNMASVDGPLAARSGEIPTDPSRQERPTFRSTTSAVLVDVSIRAGKAPVMGLAASDFILLDNGVQQRIENLSIEPLPIDLSLVVDFYDAGLWASGTRGLSYINEQRRQLKADTVNIAKLLQPTDRLRMIQVENEPYELVRLQPAGVPVPVEGGDRGFGHISYGRTSAIYDAAAVALMRFTPMGRRHLVLVFTEGADDASVLTKERLLAIAARSDAVMHLSKRKTAFEVMQEQNVRNPNPAGQYNDLLWTPEPSVIVDAARLTGGTLVNSLGGSKYEEISDIMARLRQSYLIRYQPSGVTPTGWHEIQVRMVAKGKYDIQARKGYWGG